MGPKTIEMEKVEGGMGDYCAPARGTMEIMRPEGHIMPPEGCIMPPEGCRRPEGRAQLSHYNIKG